MANPLWDRLPPFIKNHRLTASFLAFLILLAFMQAIFNFRETPQHLTAHITSSHEMKDPSLTSKGILDGTTIWHAPAEFPQWVQFNSLEPVTITQLAMMSQENSPGGREYLRSPKTFSFMGKKEDGDWQILLQVDNAVFEAGGEWKKWKVDSDDEFQFFRLIITANNGDPSLLTIHKMQLGYKQVD